MRRAFPLALLLVCACLAVPAAAAVPTGLVGEVVKIVDGDTIHIRVAGRVERVRYIGVNTPEVHHPTKGEGAGGRGPP
jgi:micrococcal nuclease